MDFKYDKIFNPWIILCYSAGLLFGRNSFDLRGIGESLLSAAVPIVLLYPLFKIGALGAGDIKLLAAFGGFFTITEIFFCILYAFFFGAGLSLIKLVKEKNIIQRISYLMSYLYDVFKKGYWEFYEQDIKENREIRKKSKIHFTLPILLSSLLWIGGVY